MNPAAKTYRTVLRKLFNRIILPIITAFIALKFFLCHQIIPPVLIVVIVYLKNKQFVVERFSVFSRDSNMFYL